MLALMSGLVALRVEADMIEFKNGMRLRGTIVKRTPTEVFVELDFGTTSFAPEEIVSIEAETPSPEEPAREALSAGSDLQSVMAIEPPLQGDRSTSGQRSPSPGKTADGVNPPPQSVELPDAMKAVAYLGALFADGSIGVGSAAIVSPKGIMVTNAHVVEGAVRIIALFPHHEPITRSKGPKPYEVRVLKTDPCYDLAVISIPAKTPNYLRFATDESIRTGQEVRAIGNPQGLGVSVSKGIISAVRTLQDMTLGTVEDFGIAACSHLSGRELSRATFVQTDAAINPGNSGGPLLNGQNEIVGINTLIVSQSGGSEGLGFAVHVKHVRKFVGAYAKP
mgnify:CR=1 FL=1